MDSLNLAIACILLEKDAQNEMPQNEYAHQLRRDTLDVIKRLIAMSHRNTKPDSDPQANDTSTVQKARELLAEIASTPPESPRSPANAYEALCQYFADSHRMHHASAILQWHQAAKLIQPEDRDAYSNASTALSIMAHEFVTSEACKKALQEALQDKASLSPHDQKNLALMERSMGLDAAIDKDLLAQQLDARMHACDGFADYKETENLEAYMPLLAQVIMLTRKVNEKKSAVLNCTPYEAGLHDYCTDMPESVIADTLGTLREKLPTLQREIMQHQAKQPAPKALPPISADMQMRVSRRLLRMMGLADNEISLKPGSSTFTIGTGTDMRICLKVDESNILNTLSSLIHEAGHALYTKQSPNALSLQPVDNYQSLWLHETQSLLWERIFEHKDFSPHLSQILCEELGVSSEEWSAQNLYALMSRVALSHVRIDADKVTYHAHIMLRHALESRLMNGTLDPADLPAEWARLSKELLGLEITKPSQGILQDIHWADGDFGYFPAYSLGHIGAAMQMECLEKTMPSFSELLGSGNFAPITQWLNTHVHARGASLTGQEILHAATGEEFSASALLRSTREHFLGTPSTHVEPGSAIELFARQQGTGR